MIRRRLARQLARHTLDVMPPERRAWALGMTAELAHIEDDGAALVFAAGAVWTGYRQGARLWSNWLRIGRWGAAFWTGLLGLALFYMSVWLGRVPEASKSSVSFSSLTLLLGFLYVVAGWSLAKRRFELLFGSVTGIAVLITSAAFALATSGDSASPWAAYAALLRRQAPVPEAFYAALLLEQFLFVALLAATGAVLHRFEGRRVTS